MKKKIIIIDDSEIFVELLTLQLTMHNYECISYSQLDQLPKDIDADILILDHFLGRKKGKQLLGYEFLTNNGNSFNQIPTIIISGQLNSEVAIKYLEEGAFDYIYKDNPECLNQIIESVKNITNGNKELQKKTAYVRIENFLSA